jgi:hypothetical protein
MFRTEQGMPHISITLDALALEALAADPKRYAMGTVQWRLGEQTAVVEHAGVRLKGQKGSFRPLTGKAAFRIDTDRFVPDQRLLGLEKLAINNLVQDPTYQREWLAYGLFRRLGLPAPRVGYAWLEVNGEPWGLYAVVESLDERPFLEAWFGSRDGLIYEGEYGEDLVDTDLPELDLDHGHDPERAALAALIDGLNAAPTHELPDAWAPWLDVEAWLLFAAAEIFTGHWDGYSWSKNNYAVHFGGIGPSWRFLPWGFDQSFVADLNPFRGQSRLSAACLESIACRKRLAQAYEAVASAAESLDLPGQAARLWPVLEPWASTDPRRERAWADVLAARADLLSYLERRPQQIRGQLSCADPSTVDADGDGYHGCGEDCHDGNALVHPNANEPCNLRDDNCNGLIDDDAAGVCDPCTKLAPAGAHQHGEFLFCFHPLPWVDAELACQSRGGHLASLRTKDERNALVAAVHDVSRVEFWIGLNDRDAEGEWRWVDGSPTSYLDWGNDQPSALDDDDCVESVPWAKGRWNDYGCEVPRAYLCRIGD